MSKITFRADDDLIDRVERLDASKSEVMREALRAYLDEHEPSSGGHRTTNADAGGREPGRADESTLDDLVAERVDELLAERLSSTGGGQDLDLTISLEGVDGADRRRVGSVDTSGVGSPPLDGSQTRLTDLSDAAPGADAAGPRARACGQCGTDLDSEHVYCPNCGERATRRVFCDCGDQIRSDWAFCPSCGRRTPAADVLDSG